MSIMHEGAELGFGATARDSVATTPGSRQETFFIKLPEQQTFFGGYYCSFSENKVDFLIEIYSFGYTSDVNVGNPHPQARQRFSPEEKVRIEELIRFLFCSPDAANIRRERFLFTSKKAKFLEDVFFLPGWLLIGSRIRMV